MPQDPAVRSQGPSPPAETEIDELERAADIPLGVSRAPRARAPRGQAASSVGSGDRQPLFATKSQASERSRGERRRSLAPDAKAPHASSISSWLQASENVAPPSGNASATGGSSHAGGLRGNSASSARGALPRYRSGGGPPSASSHRSHILPAPGRLMKSDYPDAASMRAMSNSSRLPRGARGSASIAAGAPGENVETVPEGGDLSAKTWERIASWREVSARALGSDAAEHEGASVSAAKNTQHGAARGAADASAAHKTPESSDALRRRPARPDPAIEMNTPLRNALRALTHEGLQDRIVALGIAGGLLVRALVALGGWSGRGRPPMYGDFEAQRHWIELTLHLPPAEWYRYDLQYWGLDYPPLTAWTSLLCGWVASGFPRLRTAFELDSSRGAEHTALAVFMRACVALLELAVYVPAVSWFLERRLEGRSSRTRHVALLSALLQPALILVDHGHHQYNSVMLGLAAMSFALLYSKLPNVHNGSSQPVRGAPDTHRLQVLLLESLSRQISYEYVVAAVFFTLSLCFKQMALYYAPAVFAIMLGRCVGVGRADLRRGLALFAGLGAATLATSALLFLPWLGDLAQCVHRIFPLARGVFEDKVASVWCLLSVLPLGRFKPREALPPAALAKLSAAATLAAILPGCVLLFRAAVQTAQLERVPDDAMAEQVVAHVQQRRPTSVASGRTSQVHAGPRSVASQRMPSGVRDTLAAPSARGSAHGSSRGSDRRSHAGASLAAGSTSTWVGASAGAGMPGAVPPPRPPRARPPAPPASAASSSPSSAAALLPYTLASTALAFFLLGFQTHEKSVLLPLLPLTLLMTTKGDRTGGGAAAADWEWAVLANNVAVFSLWPLLQRDGLILQHWVLAVGWNLLIGYNPFAVLRRGAAPASLSVTWLSAAVHTGMLALHALELLVRVAAPRPAAPLLRRYPDLFPVLNVLLTTPVLVLVWFWSLKKQVEVGLATGVIPLHRGPMKQEPGTRPTRTATSTKAPTASIASSRKPPSTSGTRHGDAAARASRGGAEPR